MSNKVYVTLGMDYPVRELNGLEFVTQDPGNVTYAIVGSYDPNKFSLSLIGSTLIEFDKPLIHTRTMNWNDLASKLNPEVVVGNRIVLRRATEKGFLYGEGSINLGCNVHHTNEVIRIDNP